MWCNEFAFSFLFSTKERLMEGVTSENSKLIMESHFLSDISKKYCVSKLALVYSYYKNKLIEKKTFDSYQYKQKNITSFKRKSSGGDYYATLGTRISGKYAELINTNFTRKKISISELGNLSKVKSYERFQELLGRIS